MSSSALSRSVRHRSACFVRALTRLRALLLLLLPQGCAPLETVVTLLATQSIVFKIFKPIAEVLPEEALAALRTALAGNAPQHQTDTMQQ
jgi:hypothetical protein